MAALLTPPENVFHITKHGRKHITLWTVTNKHTYNNSFAHTKTDICVHVCMYVFGDTTLLPPKYTTETNFAAPKLRVYGGAEIKMLYRT